MRDIDCPYCDEAQEINHDDGYGFKEDEIYEQECRSCEKSFAYTTSMLFLYTAYKADCLNGGEHDWIEYKRYGLSPENWRRCKGCDYKESAQDKGE